MKSFYKFSVASFSLFVFTLASFADVVKVACVGDSITYGSGIKDRDNNSYPAQLGKILGEGFDVKNFGVGGATLLTFGNKPYIETWAFKPALQFNPNVVIIKLGTNDSKPFNWFYKSNFESDLNALIDAFEKLSSNPKIYVCKPAPAYQDKWGINELTIANEVTPIIEKVAKNRGLEIIDIHKVLENKKELFPDAIHPNIEGAKLMAEKVAETLKSK